ncbi:MAG TPA: sugar phosphate nucleotidyltransferase [Lachnospiraceae bacterium]|nr:sugar phosphate nucleotidyltransferase [Lachnospiraceae bacterium]
MEMNKPVLVILAAGMGSRFGGLKQMTPIDKHGNKLIDFSIYDAIRTGFKKVVFVIQKEQEQEFRTCMGDNINKYIDIEYAYQDLTNVPNGFQVPAGRSKPWGTAHAIYCCKDLIQEPFVVTSADDYYGQSAFEVLYEYLTTHTDGEKFKYAVVGYELGNTLTGNGNVARGCCVTDQNNFLVNVTNRMHIEKKNNGAVYSEDGGKTFVPIPLETIVTMKMWGFSPSIMDELDKSIHNFFLKEAIKDPLLAEYNIPSEVDKLLQTGVASVEVLSSKDKWFGMTYKEDKAFAVESIQELKNQGVYPEKLWE